MTDIYKTPASELTEAQTREGFGSLERGQAGQYQFSIREIIKEAWDKTSGAKGTIWLAFILYMVVVVPVSMGTPMLLGMLGLPADIEPGQEINATLIIGFVLSQVIIMVVSMPLGVGLFMVGLKIASGAPVSATEVFNYFHKIVPLVLTMFLMYVMLIIGFLLFVIPGIYLMFAYYLALPLVVEKGLGPWQALEASRKAVSKRWFRFVGLGIGLVIILIVGMIPLGLGVIWVLPMMMIAFGIAYRNIFGFEGASAA